MRKLYNGTDPEYYDPQQYEKIPQPLKEAVQKWIALVIQPAKKVCDDNSYQMKHYFERSTPTACNLYLTDGEFRGAMLKAGYHPVDTEAKEWNFRVKPRSTLSRNSDKHVSGYGYMGGRFCICHVSQKEKSEYEALVQACAHMYDKEEI